jgi:hypothetical protein
MRTRDGLSLTDMLDNAGAIGGYFEIELPPKRAPVHGDAIRFQSARAAFLALLCHRRPSRVWMPTYICDAMLAPLAILGIGCGFYSLSADFDIAEDVELGDGEIFLCVNHFGVFEKACSSAIERYGAQRVVVDCAQDFFATPKKCLGVVYSPRKFFGVPDGGLLVTDLDVARPVRRHELKDAQILHLVRRLAGDPEAGYASYMTAEAEFARIEPEALSAMTERILAGIDLERVAMARRTNFEFLHARLSASNRLSLKPTDKYVPLCYPYLARTPTLRERLRESRVYTATYWPEVARRSGSGTFEKDLATNLIAIPCDQRYGEEQMARVVDLIDAAVSGKST